jgi:inward rectifier potassium channel
MQEKPTDGQQGHAAPGSGPNPAPQELGFGSQYRRNIRFINRDGTFNVRRKGMPWFRPYDLYHKLITMSWPKFLFLVFLGYMITNFLFTFLYLMVGLDHLAGVEGITPGEQFMDAFFFSSQTVTTLGYGRISPVGLPANILAAIESSIGLLGFAMATGLMYGRFSRPNARLVFSETALVAPYRGGTGFMFRLANQRSSQLIELEVQVVLTMLDPKTGRKKYHQLPLELEKINFLALSWTVVHPIDAESPLWEMSEAALAAVDAEFLILIKAFDDTFSQTIYSRSSYRFSEVEFGKAFESMISWENEMVELDLTSISATKKAQ